MVEGKRIQKLDLNQSLARLFFVQKITLYIQDVITPLNGKIYVSSVFREDLYAKYIPYNPRLVSK